MACPMEPKELLLGLEKNQNPKARSPEVSCAELLGDMSRLQTAQHSGKQTRRRHSGAQVTVMMHITILVVDLPQTFELERPW